MRGRIAPWLTLTLAALAGSCTSPLDPGGLPGFPDFEAGPQEEVVTVFLDDNVTSAWLSSPAIGANPLREAGLRR